MLLKRSAPGGPRALAAPEPRRGRLSRQRRPSSALGCSPKGLSAQALKLAQDPKDPKGCPKGCAISTGAAQRSHKRGRPATWALGPGAKLASGSGSWRPEPVCRHLASRKPANGDVFVKARAGLALAARYATAGHGPPGTGIADPAGAHPSFLETYGLRARTQRALRALANRQTKASRARKVASASIPEMLRCAGTAVYQGHHTQSACVLGAGMPTCYALTASAELVSDRRQSALAQC